MTDPSLQNATESAQDAVASAEELLVYEPNPKHKEPWQRGARGSRCPKDADGPALLAASEIDPKHPGKRYATDGGQAYCGQQHLPGRWHGYPVKWREVPPRHLATVGDGQARQQAGPEGELVSLAGFGNWEMKAGDPSVFALSLAFSPNPDGTNDRATEDERESWGSFTLWAGGENLCAHFEQDEIIQSAHWYMLPFMEWLTDNWDPLLHEERLPLQNAGASAAESLARTQLTPLSLKEIDEFDWFTTWSDWWSRHSIRAAREGGLFPDVYMRRYRDRLEISTGAETLAGIPSDFNFLTPNRICYADLPSSANAMCQVLSAAAQELHRRLPESTRVQALVERVASLTSPDRETNRMAWLAGVGDRYAQVSHAIRQRLSGASERVRGGIIGTDQDGPLVVVGSAYARLLYGAVSPTTDLADVVSLTGRIIDNYVPDASTWLARMDLPLGAYEIKQLPAGEQGSRLGEKACELLGGSPAEWIDIDSIAANADISISDIQLSDNELRAISVFGPTQRPHIFCNTTTRWASSSWARRFTLAHELCHLLLDREHGDELAIASGPWAPRAIEQRANAFAAAFLMPTWLLRDTLAMSAASAGDPETIKSASERLHVSPSSLIDRLYNLGEISLDERDYLRSAWSPERGKG
jgi:Zn-dependent peptidase ImmA (M78 family)